MESQLNREPAMSISMSLTNAIHPDAGQNCFRHFAWPPAGVDVRLVPSPEPPSHGRVPSLSHSSGVTSVLSNESDVPTVFPVPSPRDTAVEQGDFPHLPPPNL